MSLAPNYTANRAWQEKSQQAARDRALAKPRQREKQLKPSSSLKRCATLSRRTKDRSKEERQYSKKRLVFLEKHPHCVRCWDQGRKCAATEVHHKAGREGVFLLIVALWLPTCRKCHVWITANGNAAIELGYSLSRHDRWRYLNPESEGE